MKHSSFKLSFYRTSTLQSQFSYPFFSFLNKTAENKQAQNTEQVGYYNLKIQATNQVR